MRSLVPKLERVCKELEAVGFQGFGEPVLRMSRVRGRVSIVFASLFLWYVVAFSFGSSWFDRDSFSSFIVEVCSCTHNG